MLGTVRADGSPQLTVVWYAMRGDRVLINTRVGREKQRNIAREARLSLCVEDGYRAVTIDGRVVDAIDDQRVARADILALGVRYDGEAQARRQYDQTWSQERRMTYYMSIDRVHAVGFRG